MSLSKMDGIKPRLLQDFIIPHLEQGTFRDKLYWVDREQKIFRISWKHQSSSKFSPEDSCVFMHWAMVKGLWNPQEVKCNTKAKQRLRAALLKLKSVQCLSKDNDSRTYQIISSQDQTASDNSAFLGEPLLERPIFQYHACENVEVPQDIIEDLETEAFISHLLDSSSDSMKESYSF